MHDELHILRPGLHFGIIVVPFIGAPVFAKWPAIVPAAYDISILVPLIRAIVLFPDGSSIFRRFDSYARPLECARKRRAFQLAIRVPRIPGLWLFE
jgi:hypothetical protein